MSAQDNAPRKTPSRRLQKRNPNLNRLPSPSLPSRLRGGDDDQEDVTAASRGNKTSAQYMNQSIFSMIAAAGSKTDFNSRFDESSDSEDDAIQEEDEDDLHERRPLHMTSTFVAPDSNATSHKKTPSLTGKLAQSLPRLSVRSLTKKQKHPASAPKPSPSPTSDTTSKSARSNPRDAPVLTRLLTAEAEFQDNTDLASEESYPEISTSRSRAESSPETLLAIRLMEIFGFERPEKVVAEYPCWLLKSVLLQGYLYITKHHLCFYAYLPKKSHTVAKTGYLAKKGRTTTKYKRYWFSLKGDVLSYYTDPSDLYFPAGHVDLRYGLSASLSTDKGRPDSKDFAVTTDHRTYHFRADTAQSAKEWVQSLQKTIFRSHNDGDSVKISLPLQNIIDFEESPVVEFAETVKLRVVENDDSYAIDEVRPLSLPPLPLLNLA